MKQKIFGMIMAVIMLASALSLIVFAAPTVAGDTNPVCPYGNRRWQRHPFPADTESAEPEEVVIVLDTVEFKRVEPTTYDEATSLLEEAITRQELTETIYQGFLTLGYADDHPAVVLAKTDI
mgnify:CR=1 FL=1